MTVVLTVVVRSVAIFGHKLGVLPLCQRLNDPETNAKRNLTNYYPNRLDWVLSHWVHFTVHSLDFVLICVFCAFVFLTAYMLYYCQYSGVDLVGLKPSP